MSARSYPDPFGQDRLAASIAAASICLAILLTLWMDGLSIEPYRWSGGGVLPIWADLVVTAVAVSLVGIAFFVLLAAILRMGAGRQV